MKRSAKLYFSDIVEYMERAEEHIKGLNSAQFFTDK